MLKKSIFLISLSMLLGATPLLSTTNTPPTPPPTSTSASDSFTSWLDRVYRRLPQSVRDNIFPVVAGSFLASAIALLISNRNQPAVPGQAAASVAASVAATTISTNMPGVPGFNNPDSVIPCMVADQDRVASGLEARDPIVDQIRAAGEAFLRNNQGATTSESSSTSSSSTNSEREEIYSIVNRIITEYFLTSHPAWVNNRIIEQISNDAADSALNRIRQRREAGWRGNLEELRFLAVTRSTGLGIRVVFPGDINTNANTDASSSNTCNCSNCSARANRSEERMRDTNGSRRVIARLGQLTIYSDTGVARSEIRRALQPLVEALIPLELREAATSNTVIRQALNDVYGRLVDQASVIIRARLAPDFEFEIEEEDRRAEENLSNYLLIEREVTEFVNFATQYISNWPL